MNFHFYKISIGEKIRKIILFLSMFLIISAFLLIFFYFSKAINNGTLKICLNGVSSDELTTSLNVYEYLPIHKCQQCLVSSDKNELRYDCHSLFNSLYVLAPVSILKIISVINYDTKSYYINGEFMFCCNRIDLSKLIIVKPSFIKLLSNLIKWKGFIFFIIGILLLTVSILTYEWVIYRYSIMRYFGILLAIIVFFHIIFYLLFDVFLITSGVIIIALCSIVIYYIWGKIKILFKIKDDKSKVDFLIKSISVSLILMEVVLILTGALKTGRENQYKYYNKSQYVPELNSWFYIWNYDKDLKHDEFSFHRIVNSEGLSDVEHPISKDSNEFRIMAIGDSFTEGDGADKDSTWLKFLEYNFKSKPLNKKLSFINAGVCGSDVFFEYMLFKGKMLKYKPDLLILSINMSDISDVIVRGGMERFQPNDKLKYNDEPWWAVIYNTTHISRILFTSVLGYNDLFFKEGDGKDKFAIKQIFDGILLFKTLCNDNNVKLLVVFNPIKSEIINNRIELDDVMKKVELDGDIFCLNLLEFFSISGITKDNCSNYYWKYDGHHNAKGYELYARGVEWKLNQMGILDSLIIKSDSVSN